MLEFFFLSQISSLWMDIIMNGRQLYIELTRQAHHDGMYS